MTSPSLTAPDSETLCAKCGHTRRNHGDGGVCFAAQLHCHCKAFAAVPSEKEPEPLAFDVHRVVAMLLMLSRLFAGKSDQNKGKELVSIYGGDLAERQAEVATTCAQLANALPGLLATQSRVASLENSHSQALKDIEALERLAIVETFDAVRVEVDADGPLLLRSAVLHALTPTSASVPSPTPPSNG